MTVSINPNNAAFVWSPNNWTVASGIAICINPGAYFRIMFTGTTCVLNFDGSVSYPPSFVAQIDDGPWGQYTVAATVNIPIPTEMLSMTNVPYHLLTVAMMGNNYTADYWTSGGPSTRLIFQSMTLDTSAVVLKPGIAPKNILIYGDSITGAVFTLGETAALSQDGAFGLMWELGNLLGAEIGLVGFPGTGYLSGFSDVPAFTGSYNFIYSGAARPFVPVPDMIVIENGSNDQGANTTSACTTVLNGLISACPSTPIAVLRPFRSDTDQATYLQNAIAASTNPGQCHYINTAGMFNTAYGVDIASGLHPSGPNGAGIIAPQLAAVLRPILDGAVNRWTHS